MRFADEYVSHVLNENFSDAKALLLSPLMAIQYAHLVMLAQQGIVSREDARALRQALDGISEEDVRRACYDGTYEDLFFYIERLIVHACGVEIAGRLHTARSRNDIDMTMYRMLVREDVLAVLSATADLRRALMGIAERTREAVFPAHTHTQPAQPTTMAHYLLGVIEQLERDAVRLLAAFETTNRCPLGACAITGTGFPIDRPLTSELLGFAGPAVNTYGSIATVDYLLESASAAAVMLAGVGRVVQDFLFWCTAEAGYLRLSDGFVQSSSIMPQKRNPVALEHARSIGSKALGQASAIVIAVHNTPFGDVADSEDDLQPLIASMFRDAVRAVRLVAAAMREAEFNELRMAARAAEGWITITELADELVRTHRLSFRVAHGIASRLIASRATAPDVPLSRALAGVSAEVLGSALTFEEADLQRILSPQHFIEVRRTLGGPAPAETARALASSRDALARDEARLAEARRALADAEARRRERSALL